MTHLPTGYRCSVCAGEVPAADPPRLVCPHCGSDPARAVVKAVLRDPRRRHTPAEGARREKHGGNR